MFGKYRRSSCFTAGYVATNSWSREKRDEKSCFGQMAMKDGNYSPGWGGGDPIVGCMGRPRPKGMPF